MMFEFKDRERLNLIIHLPLLIISISLAVYFMGKIVFVTLFFLLIYIILMIGMLKEKNIAFIEKIWFRKEIKQNKLEAFLLEHSKERLAIEIEVNKFLKEIRNER